MADHEPVPEADAQEQAQDLGDGDDPEVEDIPIDVPEADALEQARRVTGSGNSRAPQRADVPEADALEQEAPAGGDDEDDWR